MGRRTPRLAVEADGMLDGFCDSHTGGPGCCLSSMARGGLVGGGSSAGELGEVHLVSAKAADDPDAWQGSRERGLQRAFPQV